MMNSRRSIEYFKELGLLLRQAPGRKRGGWELAPPRSHDKAKQFDSLEACWKWWRHQIIYTALELESVSIAINLAYGDPKLRASITRWAASGGWEEIPDDLMCDINYPCLTVELDDKQWFPLLEHPVAKQAWPFRYTDRYQLILSGLSERDRDALSSATASTCRHNLTRSRL